MKLIINLTTHIFSSLYLQLSLLFFLVRVLCDSWYFSIFNPAKKRVWAKFWRAPYIILIIRKYVSFTKNRQHETLNDAQSKPIFSLFLKEGVAERITCSSLLLSSATTEWSHNEYCRNLWQTLTKNSFDIERTK